MTSGTHARVIAMTSGAHAGVIAMTSGIHTRIIAMTPGTHAGVIAMSSGAFAGVIAMTSWTHVLLVLSSSLAECIAPQIMRGKNKHARLVHVTDPWQLIVQEKGKLPLQHQCVISFYVTIGGTVVGNFSEMGRSAVY